MRGSRLGSAAFALPTQPSVPGWVYTLRHTGVKQKCQLGGFKVCESPAKLEREPSSAWVADDEVGDVEVVVLVVQLDPLRPGQPAQPPEQVLGGLQGGQLPHRRVHGPLGGREALGAGGGRPHLAAAVVSNRRLCPPLPPQPPASSFFTPGCQPWPGRHFPGWGVCDGPKNAESKPTQHPNLEGLVTVAQLSAWAPPG